MKTATVADLRNNFASLSKWIHDGEAVTITKRGTGVRDSHSRSEETRNPAIG